MKTNIRILSIILLLCLIMGSFASCNNGQGGEDGPVHVDYVEQTKLDMNSSTKKLEVTMKSHIDGDTTHFHVPTSVDVTGVMKARYLAINTPESTGKIEEWGKAASAFTKEKLTNAVSIIVESEDSSWNFDGNGRFLVWVWYKPAEGADYRNLNLEILQNGLAVGSKAGSTIYGEAAVAAIAQASAEKLYIFSDDIDPQFPYGEATGVTLKELRVNIEDYNGAKVAFEGVITYNSDWTAYIEEYDPETDMYYGIQLFYGYDSNLIKPLAQGNRVRVVGVVGSFHGTYQVSDLSYNRMKPQDPANTAVISKDNEIPFRETTAEEFYGNVKIETEEESVDIPFTKLAVSTSISMKNLKVVRTYTTQSNGEMTLTCQVDGKTIDVRTALLKDAEGNVITESYFKGATIDVQGIIDYFDLNDTGNGTYQIKVYSLDEIVKH
jgi:micrococcal nuclease